MGTKGERETSASGQSAELLLARIDGLGNITSKKMFGGYGIFNEGKMFGIVDSKGNCFLKVDDDLKLEFEALGSEKHSKMPYFSIPESVINDHDKLSELTSKSMALVK